MKLSAIVLDLDGTLLNTLKDLNAACNYALRLYRYEPITLEETRQFIGNGIHRLIERALKGRREYEEEVFTAFKAYYHTHYSRYTVPYAGVEEFLFYCREHKIKTAVLSNKEQSILDLLCAKHFPNTFELVVGERPGLRKKPDTDGLELICRKLSVRMEDILYIGDSDVDVKTAANAGCHGAFVSYGFRREEELRAVGAELVFPSLPKIIEELGV